MRRYTTNACTSGLGETLLMFILIDSHHTCFKYSSSPAKRRESVMCGVTGQEHGLELLELELESEAKRKDVLY